MSWSWISLVHHFGLVSEHFLTGLGPCVAFALLFFITYKPHFTSATKMKVIDVTTSMG